MAKKKVTNRPVAIGTVIGGRPLNIRKEPIVKDNIIGKYQDGDAIEILEIYGDWYRTKDGYVMSKFIDVIETVNEEVKDDDVK